MRGIDLQDRVEVKDLDLAMTVRLIRFARPHLPLVIAGFLAMSFSTACSLLQPYIIKLAVDNNLVKGTLEGFFTYAALFALSVLGAMAFSYLQMVTVAILGQRVILDMRRKLFRKVTALPLSYFDRTPSGRVITRLTSDIEAVNEMISSGLISVMGDVILITSISVVLFLMNRKLFYFTLISLAVLFTFVQIMKVRLRGANRLLRRNTARINAFLQEYISGIGVVKSFAQESKVERKFAGHNLEFRKVATRLSSLYSLYFPGVEFISTCALAVVLWQGGLGVIGGTVTIGTVIAFAGYLEKFFGPVRDMSDKYNILQSALASCERIFTILDMDSSPEYLSPLAVPPSHHTRDVSAGEDPFIIEFRDVDFDYGGEEVLKGFSLAIGEGERVAIVGPTGAGKTTVINLLMRMYGCQSGAITMRGRDIASYDVDELRRKIVIIPQEPFLFTGTVSENIVAGDGFDKNRLDRALKSCGIVNFIDALQEGLDTNVGERGSRLSAGQRQLVSFARAVYRQPEVLVLDEATASVDPETEHEVTKALKKMMEGKTSIVIAHRLQTVVECDRIAVVVGGRVIEEGPHEKLLKTKGLYSTLYNLQATS